MIMQSMNNNKIAILTYTVPHRKTYDILTLLKACGYKSVTVFAQPMTYQKKRKPMVSHRPELIMSIPETKQLCNNLDYCFIEGEFKKTISTKYDNHLFLLAGAGLLPDSFVRTHRIINSHPGYIPYARGLDAYKWSIYKKLPIGVTTHFLGEYVDAGEIIERRIIEVREYDTFHSVAQRLYENEIDMMIGAIKLINNKHDYIIPDERSLLFKRMSKDKELELYEKFDEYKKDYKNIVTN